MFEQPPSAPSDCCCSQSQRSWSRGAQALLSGSKIEAPIYPSKQSTSPEPSIIEFRLSTCAPSLSSVRCAVDLKRVVRVKVLSNSHSFTSRADCCRQRQSSWSTEYSRWARKSARSQVCLMMVFWRVRIARFVEGRSMSGIPRLT